MSRLIIVRHAHANAGTPDHERALSERGRHQASQLGSHLAALLTGDVHVRVSSAVRAHQTWSRAGVAAGRGTSAWCTDPRLYRAIDDDVPTLLSVLADAPATADTVVIVGHDPGLTSLVQHLTGGAGEPTAWQEMGAHLRKATAAVLEGQWRAPAGGVLRQIVRA